MAGRQENAAGERPDAEEEQRIRRDRTRSQMDRARSQRDREAIGRLADELLPALIARLGASDLGEIEVREGGWKARLRKPAPTGESVPAFGRMGEARTGSNRQGAAVAGGAAGSGRAEAAGRGGNSVRSAAAARGGALAGAAGPFGPNRGDAAEITLAPQDWDALTGDEPDQEIVAAADFAVATSPAVGIYHPRRDLTAGMNIRAGDRVGFVDVLGVHQDVVAPVDGIIGSSLAEAGEAVEYGQELVQLEPPGTHTAGAAWIAGPGLAIPPANPASTAAPPAGIPAAPPAGIPAAPPAGIPAASPEPESASPIGQEPAGHEPAGRGNV